MDQAETELREHWQATLGSVPPKFVQEYEMNPIIGEAHTRLRKWIIEDHPDGLPRAMKELLFVYIDIFCQSAEGGMSHLREARKAGLTEMQLREALSLIVMTLGPRAWMFAGADIWESRNDGAEV